MSIERTNPRPELPLYAVLHLPHRSYFAYRLRGRYLVLNDLADVMLSTDSLSDLAVFFCEASTTL
jgi:hypothetical protein